VETLASQGVTRFVEGVEVRAGGQTLSGTVDLGPTLERIEAGGTFPHANDGSIFLNLEGLLPQQAPGYYREFVHNQMTSINPAREGPAFYLSGEHLPLGPAHVLDYFPIH
jgi:hypothetical protein